MVNLNDFFRIKETTSIISLVQDTTVFTMVLDEEKRERSCLFLRHFWQLLNWIKKFEAATERFTDLGKLNFPMVVWIKAQANYSENASTCSKRTLKMTFATQPNNINRKCSSQNIFILGFPGVPFLRNSDLWISFRTWCYWKILSPTLQFAVSRAIWVKLYKIELLWDLLSIYLRYLL